MSSTNYYFELHITLNKQHDCTTYQLTLYIKYKNKLLKLRRGIELYNACITHDLQIITLVKSTSCYVDINDDYNNSYIMIANSNIKLLSQLELQNIILGQVSNLMKHIILIDNAQFAPQFEYGLDK